VRDLAGTGEVLGAPAEERSNRHWLPLALYARDRQYVVADGQGGRSSTKATGRAMPDRAWERGLHQMIEAKEGLALTASATRWRASRNQRLFLPLTCG
jgi:preprotein translocase subunit SecA